MLTVVIPCFNSEKTIERAVLSALQLGGFVTNVLVVDDGSTDNSLAIVEAISDRRVALFKFEENRGVSSARNLGLDKVESGYICFLDSDDCFVDGVGDDVYSALVGNELNVLCFSYYINGKKAPPPREGVSIYVEFFVRKFSNTNTIIFKKIALGDNRFDEAARIGEDTEFWFKLLLANKNSLKYVDKAIAIYDYEPKVNYNPIHPMLDTLGSCGLSDAEREVIERILRRSIATRGAFSRKISVAEAYKNLGCKGIAFWLAGPAGFKVLWRVRHWMS